MSQLLFVIVGTNEPLYEIDLSSHAMMKTTKNTTSTSTSTTTTSPTTDAVTRQSYFVLHSALDLVEQRTVTTSLSSFTKTKSTGNAVSSTTTTSSSSSLSFVPTTTNMYLKVVDQVNQQQVSAFVTAGNMKFLLLHHVPSSSSSSSTTSSSMIPTTNEESIRQFFQDVYELYVKYSMNPFYAYDTPIVSVAWETRIRALGRKYFF